MRPLLGRPLEEAKLLWAITTILAKERNCPIDGKLVARAVKDYQEGRLARYVALGEALMDNKNRFVVIFCQASCLFTRISLSQIATPLAVSQ